MKLPVKYLLAAIGFMLLFVGSVYATHELFTAQIAGANDFLPRWVGAKLFWQEGVDPYSQVATETIQGEMYGRLATPDEDQALFVYPFYTIFLLLPLTWLPLAYSWIQAIWLVILQFSLIGGVLLLLRLVEWPPLPVWLLAIILLWSVIFYNNTRTIILGQFAGLIFLGLVASLLALKQGHDVWAGILLSLTTIKPQMSFLLIPALLLWGVMQRRWRFVAGFGGAMGVLLSASFLLLPGWLAGFWTQMTAYPGYTFTGSPIWVLTGYYFPQLGKPVETGLIVILVGYMLAMWWRLRRVTAVTPEFLLIIGLTLVVTNTIVVRTATTNYIIMYVPLFLGLQVMAERWPRGNVWAALFFLLSTIGMWTLFLATIKGDLEHPIMYLPLPIGLLLLLTWGRNALIGRKVASTLS
ncbi:MAG: glycosyltransferase family 87 protein [Chloroflexota bacterium]